MWPWCNTAASQRRPYCASVKSHSTVGLVSRQWDAVDWACVLCGRRIHNDQASRSASSRQCACLFYISRAGFFGKAPHHPGLSIPLQPRYGSLRLLALTKAKIAFEREGICEFDGHTLHSQRRLTADWLAPRESNCSRMDSKVSSDWMPSYIKATRLVLETFKAGYIPYSSHCSIAGCSSLFKQGTNNKSTKTRTSSKHTQWKGNKQKECRFKIQWKNRPKVFYICITMEWVHND
jgi:hypothetical protein